MQTHLPPCSMDPDLSPSEFMLTVLADPEAAAAAADAFAKEATLPQLVRERAPSAIPCDGGRWAWVGSAELQEERVGTPPDTPP